jgi:hypothetical protein
MSSPLTTLTRVESALLWREPAAVLFTLALPLLLLALNGSSETSRRSPSAGWESWM